MGRTTMAGNTFLLALIAALARTAYAATVSHDFNIGWVTANPDGAFDRPAIGINGQWPIPRIDANVGDTVLINVHNDLGNQSTSLHFHGLYMNGTTHMDGPAQVSQCAIPPGSSFTYNFTVSSSYKDEMGEEWSQGALIIHDPSSPFKDQYDEEVVVSLSDWYHDQMANLIPGFINKGNPTGAEPVPQAALMNDTQNLTVSVQPGKTYLFRMVNMAAFAGQYVWIEGHNISIVEVDGVYTEPAEASMIYISAAQRYSFLVKTRNDTTSNFAIVGSMDTEQTLFDTLPADLNYNVTGWLVYDASKPLSPPATLDTFDPFDDMTLTPYDKQPLLPEPSRTVELDVIMDNLGDGANYAFFNNITYKAPKVPTLYTALSAGDAAATSPEVYGDYTHSFVLERGDVVQIVVNNLDSGRHPFHLHGHDFQALYRAPEEGGTFADANVTEADFPAMPMRRDTLVVWPNGNIVLRFRANNPGVWLFHCHIEWHVTSGLLATFVEAPLDLQKTLSIPQSHLDVCAAANVPTTGNAAGNTKDFLDLSGQNAPPGRLPDGFTARGIVALVFSCVTGILGVLVVAWYGLAKTEDGPSGARYAGSASGTAATVAHTGDAQQKEPVMVGAVSGGSGAART
ncbi:iron transport multicopper oxidase FET3 [Colletotrichum spaethianum]|uniref:Iron transport multicopper oxidase FET3 n=1 Tax=Colletotrichum spaethianum TaxID=700344 RepID=A0AA37PD35_9PEZI|nr:iron transport multicopper oxidase FET3 [Colletotrichum spaethianum]GKT49915.1 iron transport multicopper oxidase FET3 [Colletotrichum spaethianum]